MKSFLCAFFFLKIVQVIYSQLELENFYPYGPANGDTSVPTNDDGSSGRVNIAFPFPFFDVEHEFLFVNTNGVISFLVEVSQYTPDAFPLGNNRRLIAPFWADVDTTNGGVVYYRETQDLALRTRASEEIRKFFVRQSRFLAKWVLVVTWLNVAHYGGRSFPNNTFQTILTTDGINAFAIFYYKKIEWTFGTASHGIPAQAGFNAGDGVRYFTIPNSRTAGIINIASTSNYQRPGLWIFQVDGETVENHGCTSHSGLVLSPRSGIELGGTKIFIGGPCYVPEHEIVCRFNKTIQTFGVYVSPELAYCITPPLYFAGLIQVELSLDGGIAFNFTGTFRSLPLGRNPPDIQGLEAENWANSTNMVVTWNNNSINASHVDIEISLFDDDEYRLHEGELVTFKNVTNSGEYFLDFSEDKVLFSAKRRRKRAPITASPIAVVRIISSLPRAKLFLPIAGAKAALFSSAFIVHWLVDYEELCNNWHASENRLEIEKLQEELPPCPRSYRQIRADDDFVEDKKIKHLLSKYIFHPGSSACFRSRRPSPSGAGQQCCYQGDSLIVGPPGGGSLDVVSPEKSTLNHFKRDVLPYLACCLFTDNCAKYYQRRPSDDGSRYVPPPVADTRGDPHLSTFDGTFYTFNGYGEYVFLRVNNSEDVVEFQGRMVPVLNDQGGETRATALTALVLKTVTSDTVQVEFNSRRLIDVFVNGQRVDFDEQFRLDFQDVFIVKQNRSKVGIFFTIGLSLDIKAIEDFLTYQISIPTRFKGLTAGLLGYWDDDRDQEFLLPNGSFINTNSNDRTIHNEFGQKWIVDRNRTLFTYHIGKSYDTFLDQNFTPVFLDEAASLFSNSTLEEQAKNICGENVECLFDVAVTGKTSVGEATLEAFTELQERANNSKIVAQPIYFGCDGVEDSGKETDLCGVCGGDNSSCTDCQGLIRPGFANNGTCGFYHPWTKWSACLKIEDKKMRSRNRACSIQGQCRHLPENTQFKDCDDDDPKGLKFYLLVVGLPVLGLLMIFFVSIGRYCCYNKENGKATKKPGVSSHVNNAYITKTVSTIIPREQKKTPAKYNTQENRPREESLWSSEDLILSISSDEMPLSEVKMATQRSFLEVYCLPLEYSFYFRMLKRCSVRFKSESRRTICWLHVTTWKYHWLNLLAIKLA